MQFLKLIAMFAEGAVWMAAITLIAQEVGAGEAVASFLLPPMALVFAFQVSTQFGWFVLAISAVALIVMAMPEVE